MYQQEAKGKWRKLKYSTIQGILAFEEIPKSLKDNSDTNLDELIAHIALLNLRHNLTL